MRGALAPTLLVCLAACASAQSTGPDAVSAPAPRADPRLRASSPRPPSPVVVPMDGDALARVPAMEMDVSFGRRHTACRVVAVHRLLEDARLLPVTAPAGLERYVLAIAGDGRRVLFSLAELDPHTGGRRVVVTRDCNGGSGEGRGRGRVLLALDDATAARRLDGVETLVVVAAP